jgi:hypothetical protein
LCIDIIERGVPFDSLSVPPPNLNQGRTARTMGGLGIFPQRTMVDAMTYHRYLDQNACIP